MNDVLLIVSITNLGFIKWWYTILSKMQTVFCLPQTFNGLEGIHMCLFVFYTKFCTRKIIQWDFFGIAIMQK